MDRERMEITMDISLNKERDMGFAYNIVGLFRGTFASQKGYSYPVWNNLGNDTDSEAVNSKVALGTVGQQEGKVNHKHYSCTIIFGAMSICFFNFF